MQINIPDKLYKFLLLVGVTLIGYSSYEINKAQDAFISKAEKEYKMIDSFQIADVYVENAKNDILEASKDLSAKFNIKNPVSIRDSTIVHSHYLGNKIINDSITKLVKIYKNEVLKQDVIKAKLKNVVSNVTFLKNVRDIRIQQNNDFYILGVVFFSIGIAIWLIDILIKEEEKNELLTKQNERLYKYCQSCGNEFNSIYTYAKNKDKTTNYAFCKNCFKNGRFKNKKTTRDDIIENHMDNLKKSKKDNWFSKTLIKNRIHQLDRWK